MEWPSGGLLRKRWPTAPSLNDHLTLRSDLQYHRGNCFITALFSSVWLVPRSFQKGFSFVHYKWAYSTGAIIDKASANNGIHNSDCLRKLPSSICIKLRPQDKKEATQAIRRAEIWVEIPRHDGSRCTRQSSRSPSTTNKLNERWHLTPSAMASLDNERGCDHVHISSALMSSVALLIADATTYFTISPSKLVHSTMHIDHQ